MTDPTPLAQRDLVPLLFGHAAFQQLNAFCELGLAELLSERPGLTGAQVAEALRLPPRSADVLLLGATALRLTVKDGDRYRNARLVTEWIDDGLWSNLRDIVEFQARIAYAPAAEYVDSLRNGENLGLRHFAGDTRDLYSRLAGTPGLEELFYRGMNSWSRVSNPVLVRGVDYSGVRRILDVGGGGALNAIELARTHPHLRVTVLDRPSALDVAAENIGHAGLSDRIDTYAADIFEDDYPAGYDCHLFAHQLVIWSPEQNKRLLGKSLRALDPGGRTLVFNAFTDDDGGGPLYTALDGVYFTTLPFESSTIYPWSAYEGWLRELGYASQRRVTLETWTPHGVVEGHKSASAG
ncbi:methyltransferase domain-containing protein [Streptomyces olivaceus]|uniref:Methyltransferase n=1 Tax=Streptomyces olivaceus TaxID=47716 RepID=A0A2R3ZQ32_STROV|nr:methyltransferase [Streptomyces olivaceus]AVR52605.1 methyltransferase [Streptomyces olivaceus]MBZ6089953.1 methyltransferase domain-containing protein [Streptomyces olivaceus]MBZ6098464.1 methyltransferase domain-containing protein [Streptomyces olivaceus]MBZ6101303.1 methyltransferase domain-containing protein [Streptomyces olivaceus]MBZ6119267.1 methyltransferase domain-containing protein [Streptomyces olivaceus]